MISQNMLKMLNNAFGDAGRNYFSTMNTIISIVSKACIIQKWNYYTMKEYVEPCENYATDRAERHMKIIETKKGKIHKKEKILLVINATHTGSHIWS